ncbi:MAG TPA: hypothetical protein PLS03_02745 [Terrimicrobiaceae bacterium]|nr:hypothetical protein [Terrimicrobiaceae bacterium]
MKFPQQTTSLLSTLFLAIGGPLIAADEPASPSGTSFLLADDHFVDAKEGLRRILEAPVKKPKPVLTATQPWEQNPYLFGSVLYDAKSKQYRMWYMSYNRDRTPLERTPILYATSKNGVAWEKPSLGVYEFAGSKQNNIVLGSLGFHDLYSPSVIEDPASEDPQKRFKMIFWDKTGEDTYKDGGMHVAFSADGIHWQRYEKNPVLKAGRNDRSISDVMDVMQDPLSGKFVVYAKGWNNEAWKDDGKENTATSQRIILRSESADFLNWSKPEPVIRHARTESDPQSYGMPVFFHEGMYFGLMRSYKVPGDEKIDIRLMGSRDGKTWTPVCDGQTFLAVGSGDETWDDGMVFTAPPLVVGKRILIYYGGWDGPHQSKYRHSAIGLAELPAGRVAALTPETGTGTLTTKPFPLNGNQIALNAQAENGACRVAVLDAEGKEIPGFGWADCEPVATDGSHLVVTWKNASLSTLADRPVRLKFEITGAAKLYGFQVDQSANAQAGRTDKNAG